MPSVFCFIAFVSCTLGPAHLGLCFRMEEVAHHSNGETAETTEGYDYGGIENDAVAPIHPTEIGHEAVAQSDIQEDTDIVLARLGRSQVEESAIKHAKALAAPGIYDYYLADHHPHIRSSIVVLEDQQAKERRKKKRNAFAGSRPTSLVEKGKSKLSTKKLRAKALVGRTTKENRSINSSEIDSNNSKLANIKESAILTARDAQEAIDGLQMVFEKTQKTVLDAATIHESVRSLKVCKPEASRTWTSYCSLSKKRSEEKVAGDVVLVVNMKSCTISMGLGDNMALTQCLDNSGGDSQTNCLVYSKNGLHCDSASTAQAKGSETPRASPPATVVPLPPGGPESPQISPLAAAASQPPSAIPAEPLGSKTIGLEATAIGPPGPKAFNWNGSEMALTNPPGPLPAKVNTSESVPPPPVTSNGPEKVVGLESGTPPPGIFASTLNAQFPLPNPLPTSPSQTLPRASTPPDEKVLPTAGPPKSPQSPQLAHSANIQSKEQPPPQVQVPRAPQSLPAASTPSKEAGSSNALLPQSPPLASAQPNQATAPQLPQTPSAENPMGKPQNAILHISANGADKIVKDPALIVRSLDTDLSHSSSTVGTQDVSALGIIEAQILSRHNVYRCMHDVPKLRWNTAIADNAKRWARRASEHIKHSPASERGGIGGFEYIGENIVWGQNMVGALGVDQWYNEFLATANHEGSSNPANEALLSNVGHFSQIVWKDTTEMGCGSSGLLLVCHYGPGGNRMGQYMFNVLPKNTKSLEQCEAEMNWTGLANAQKAASSKKKLKRRLQRKTKSLDGQGVLQEAATDSRAKRRTLGQGQAAAKQGLGNKSLAATHPIALADVAEEEPKVLVKPVAMLVQDNVNTPVSTHASVVSNSPEAALESDQEPSTPVVELRKAFTVAQEATAFGRAPSLSQTESNMSASRMAALAQALVPTVLAFSTLNQTEADRARSFASSLKYSLQACGVFFNTDHKGGRRTVPADFASLLQTTVEKEFGENISSGLVKEDLSVESGRSWPSTHDHLTRALGRLPSHSLLEIDADSEADDSRPKLNPARSASLLEFGMSIFEDLKASWRRFSSAWFHHKETTSLDTAAPEVMPTQTPPSSLLALSEMAERKIPGPVPPLAPASAHISRLAEQAMTEDQEEALTAAARQHHGRSLLETTDSGKAMVAGQKVEQIPLGSTNDWVNSDVAAKLTAKVEESTLELNKEAESASTSDDIASQDKMVKHASDLAHEAMQLASMMYAAAGSKTAQKELQDAGISSKVETKASPESTTVTPESHEEPHKVEVTVSTPDSHVKPHKEEVAVPTPVPHEEPNKEEVAVSTLESHEKPNKEEVAVSTPESHDKPQNADLTVTTQQPSEEHHKAEVAVSQVAHAKGHVARDIAAEYAVAMHEAFQPTKKKPARVKTYAGEPSAADTTDQQGLDAKQNSLLVDHPLAKQDPAPVKQPPAKQGPTPEEHPLVKQDSPAVDHPSAKQDPAPVDHPPAKQDPTPVEHPPAKQDIAAVVSSPANQHTATVEQTPTKQVPAPAEHSVSKQDPTPMEHLLAKQDSAPAVHPPANQNAAPVEQTLTKQDPAPAEHSVSKQDPAPAEHPLATQNSAPVVSPPASQGPAPLEHTPTKQDRVPAENSVSKQDSPPVVHPVEQTPTKQDPASAEHSVSKQEPEPVQNPPAKQDSAPVDHPLAKEHPAAEEHTLAKQDSPRIERSLAKQDSAPVEHTLAKQDSAPVVHPVEQTPTKQDPASAEHSVSKQEPEPVQNPPAKQDSAPVDHPLAKEHPAAEEHTLAKQDSPRIERSLAKQDSAPVEHPLAKQDPAPVEQASAKQDAAPVEQARSVPVVEHPHDEDLPKASLNPPQQHIIVPGGGIMSRSDFKLSQSSQQGSMGFAPAVDWINTQESARGVRAEYTNVKQEGQAEDSIHKQKLPHDARLEDSIAQQRHAQDARAPEPSGESKSVQSGRVQETHPEQSPLQQARTEASVRAEAEQRAVPAGAEPGDDPIQEDELLRIWMNCVQKVLKVHSTQDEEGKIGTDKKAEVTKEGAR
eukprot:TRINITY_DN8386_c0_g2_i1.p1 TRINITY_DN8386_c0_g2~~TRINITY_DN8386_c0_g2_i1.p1  ORF type:complete len:2036 (-),score=349.70 TRINITY_DN8386_c0_g2_i1:314-6421(-)